MILIAAKCLGKIHFWKHVTQLNYQLLINVSDVIISICSMYFQRLYSLFDYVGTGLHAWLLSKCFTTFPHHKRKSTGLNNKMNDGWTPAGFRALVLCIWASCHKFTYKCSTNSKLKENPNEQHLEKIGRWIRSEKVGGYSWSFLTIGSQPGGHYLH